MTNTKKIAMKFVAPLIAGMLISAIILVLDGFFLESTSTVDKYRFLCDSSFIAAALLIGAGAFRWVANLGIGKGTLSSLKRSLIPFAALSNKKSGSESDFHEERKPAPTKPARYLLITGVLFELLSNLFYFLYRSQLG